MGRINVLDKFTAEKIAAGEVVERPASVIKELVENSIDAGATSVTVEIRSGGIAYMRVTDNGCGMDAVDARTAFLRHATSKIKTATDLESISTLGFRGEALCSIAAVSRTELFTKQRSSDVGTHVVVEGGEEISFGEAGCPDGTTIVVKNLFFNTPARLKFMKKDSAEASCITDICNKQALSHPDVSIRLIRDGKEVFFSPGDNILKNAVHSVYGKDIASSVADVNYEKGGIRVTGLTGKNNLSRPNRLMQIFFVNGRYVVSKTLSTALSEAYKNELMIGRFPASFLNITVEPSLVDVNVHPGKIEVKFAFDRDVYEAVYWAIKNALNQAAAPREVLFTQNKNAYKLPIEQKEAVQMPIFEQKSSKSISFKPFVPQEIKKDFSKKPLTVNQIREEVQPFSGKLPVREIEGIKNTQVKEAVKDEPLFPKEAPRETEKQPAATPESALGEIDVRVIGQLFSTYILAEGDGEFFLMDQHAAHERIRYEKIRQNGYKTDTQLLLMPLSITLTPVEKALALEKDAFLSDMGFEIEDFGNNAVVLRSLPADCPYDEGADLFVEMLGILAGNESGEITAVRDKAVYTVACRSAIKANQSLSLSELEKLYKQAASLEGITTCPHGRPIIVKLSKYQIEKMFGRIV